jgi:hypothetical protein
MSVTLSYTAAGDATYATFWRRLAAYVIDALLLFLPSLLIVAAWQYEMLPRGPVSPAELRLWRQVVGITWRSSIPPASKAAWGQRRARC